MITRLPEPDSALNLLKEGYAFAPRRFERIGEDTFRTRVAGIPMVWGRGRDAASLSYDAERVTRRRSIPPSVQHLLQDAGSVQGLDDDAHHHRKSLFRTVLIGEGPGTAGRILAEEWQAAVPRWARRERIVLHDEAQVLLTRTALRFAGIDLTGADVAARARELALMVDRVATLGPPNWAARGHRRRTERWAGELVTATRAGELRPPAGTALAEVAAHRDLDGTLLPVEVAAVELINVLRPLVAVSRFVAFAAHALVTHGGWADTFADGAEDDLRGFVQEVRRFYPFFPAVPGRVRVPTPWHGETLEPGDWFMADLYGTNHHPDLWSRPERFDPVRFRHWDGDLHTLVPQGAGDVATGHRCPGELVTIHLMEEAVRQLTRGMRFEVPAQDLSIRLNRFPGLPREGVQLTRVRER